MLIIKVGIFVLFFITCCKFEFLPVMLNFALVVTGILYIKMFHVKRSGVINKNFILEFIKE